MQTLSSAQIQIIRALASRDQWSNTYAIALLSGVESAGFLHEFLPLTRTPFIKSRLKKNRQGVRYTVHKATTKGRRLIDSLDVHDAQNGRHGS